MLEPPRTVPGQPKQYDPLDSVPPCDLTGMCRSLPAEPTAAPATWPHPGSASPHSATGKFRSGNCCRSSGPATAFSWGNAGPDHKGDPLVSRRINQSSFEIKISLPAGSGRGTGKGHHLRRTRRQHEITTRSAAPATARADQPIPQRVEGATGVIR